MGCDIHSFAEKRNNQSDRWEILGDIFPLSDSSKLYYEKDFGNEPFSWRHYFMFSFLGNVRNYLNYECICLPKGLPDKSDYLDSPCDDDEYHVGDTIRDDVLDNEDCYSHSYLTVAELLSYDYEKLFPLKHAQPNYTDKLINYKTLLGKDFFEDLEILKQQGDPNDVRIVFWFTN